jgi:hypothetical protein
MKKRKFNPVNIILFVIVVLALLCIISTAHAGTGTLYETDVTLADSLEYTTQAGWARTGYRMAVSASGDLLCLYQHTTPAAGFRILKSTNQGSTWATDLDIFDNTYQGTPTQANIRFWDDSGYAFQAEIYSAGDNASIRAYNRTTQGILDTFSVQAGYSSGGRGGFFTVGTRYGVFHAEECGATDSSWLFASDGALTQGQTYRPKDSIANIMSGDMIVPFSYGALGGSLFFRDPSATEEATWIDTLGWDTARSNADVLLTAVAANLNINATWPGQVVDSFGLLFEQINITDGADSVIGRPFLLSGVGSGAVTLTWLDTALMQAHTTIPTACYAWPCYSQLSGTCSTFAYMKKWPNVANVDSADIMMYLSVDSGKTWDAGTIIYPAIDNDSINYMQAPPVVHKVGTDIVLWVGWTEGLTNADNNLYVYKYVIAGGTTPPPSGRRAMILKSGS